MSLPAETVVEGVRRLGWLALAYVMASIAGRSTRLVLATMEGTILSGLGLADLFGLAAVAMAFVVFVLARRGGLSSKRLLDLGLVLQVVGALGIAVREFSHGLPESALNSLMVPFECVWIMAYAVAVPNTPKKILIASLLAASMGPVALAISSDLAGQTAGRPLNITVYFLRSTYLSAMLAYAIARVVHRFHRQLKDAREIGSYALVEQIGSGGMGEVWRAEHRLLARPAAVKLIRSSMLGESARTRDLVARRFEREARETAALGSVHTVDIYDFGVTRDGDFYYVMELLQGLSIEQLVKELGAVDPGRTVYLLRQVCHSLAEAHARGLIHRDVKPANILVCRLGPDDDFVKVLDFGLVKHTAPPGPTVSMLSLDGVVMGTPSYMAPEIALGRADVDGRADIYSLGCVAYYMLTGQDLFSGETPVATALAHVRDVPIPPGLLSTFKIPPALEALIMECLAKDPAKRPESAAILGERLAAAVPADTWTAAAAHLWWERHLRSHPAA